MGTRAGAQHPYAGGPEHEKCVGPHLATDNDLAVGNDEVEDGRWDHEEANNKLCEQHRAQIAADVLLACVWEDTPVADPFRNGRNQKQTPEQRGNQERRLRKYETDHIGQAPQAQ